MTQKKEASAPQIKTKSVQLTPKCDSTKVRILSQLSKVAAYFSINEGTMLDCAIATGIYRANICRYIPILIDAGRIIKSRRGIDRTTKNGAWYYRATSEKGGAA